MVPELLGALVDFDYYSMRNWVIAPTRIVSVVVGVVILVIANIDNKNKFC